MLYNWYIRLEFLLCGLIVLGTIFEQTKLVSLIFSLTFICLLITWFYDIYRTQKLNLLLLTIILLAIINVFINAGYTSLELVAFSQYSKKLIIFITTVFSFYIATVFIPTKQTRRWLAWLPVGMGSLFIISYYFLGNTITMAKGITLGFTNPNFTAVWLMHLLLYGVYNFFATHKLWLRILCLGYCIIMTNLMFLTLSRACMGGVVAFGILLVWGLLKPSYKLSPVIIWSVLLFPIVFALVYMSITHYLMYTSDFDMIVSEGKSIISRVGIWTKALDSFKHSWWTGDYAGISEGLGMSQMHNTHIDILASYGIVPFILFIMILWNILKKINNQLNSLPAYVALISFLSIFLTGTFEAGLVAGCTGLNFLTSGFLLLANTGDTQ